MPTATQNGLAFTTSVRRTEPIPFTLDDVEYTFTPPKTAGIFLAAVDFDPARPETGIGTLKSQFDWLDAGLGAEQAARLEARLRDPDDDFDIDTVTRIISSLVARSTGRPTPAPSD